MFAKPDFNKHVPSDNQANFVHPGVAAHACPQFSTGVLRLLISLPGQSHPVAHFPLLLKLSTHLI